MGASFDRIKAIPLALSLLRYKGASNNASSLGKVSICVPKLHTHENWPLMPPNTPKTTIKQPEAKNKVKSRIMGIKMIEEDETWHIKKDIILLMSEHMTIPL